MVKNKRIHGCRVLCVTYAENEIDFRRSLEITEILTRKVYLWALYGLFFVFY